MATKKISELSTTTTPASGALFPIVQSSDNFAVTLENIAANLPAVTATSITSSTTITATSGFVGNLTGNVTGNADTATALATGRTIGMTGDVTWTSSSFDGTGNVTGTAAIGTGVIVNADVNASAAIDATKIHDGTVSNTEFGYLNGVSSAIQTQIDTKITASSTDTLTNKTFDANGTGNSLSNVEVADLASGVLDTDLSSVSASDDTLASAKAIKTYVDAQVTAQDLDFQADTGGALSIDLDSETLTFTGGTGIDTSGLGNAVTFAIDSTVATLTGAQTLTNKTINSASNTITITESNISDLGAYITASSTDTLTNKSGSNSQWTNDAGYITASSTDTLTNKSGNISQWTNDSAYLTGNQTITLSGDASGSGTTAITVTVADDSHNHIISNVDGLQTALDGKVPQTSTTGSAEIPTGTTGERDGSPSAGYLRFNSTTSGFEGYDGTAWGSIGGGASAGGAIYENADDITSNYTITSGKNGFSVGPMTIASGVTVTVPSGQRWVIL